MVIFSFNDKGGLRTMLPSAPRSAAAWAAFAGPRAPPPPYPFSGAARAFLALLPLCGFSGSGVGALPLGAPRLRTLLGRVL